MTTRSHRTPWNGRRYPWGVCYYPEHWDASLHERDVQRMADAGVTAVRLAEFSWDLFEPSPDVYEFGLYDRILDLFHRARIDVILGTPTATPPRWLTHAHPEVLRVDAKGVRMQHGSRQHACTTNPRFRALGDKIVQRLANHVRSHPAVVGWQIDNEFHCHFSECHCAACQVGFQQYLIQHYDGDLGRLNRAWGTAFWSQTLSSFAEIKTPVEGLPAYPNPSARLDYLRFISASVTEFQAAQVAILRQENPAWWITHNGIFANIDYRGKFSDDLDVLGVDVYPMFAHDERERYHWQSNILDRTRCASGNFLVLEQQAGAGGQATYLLDTPAPGEMRQMAYVSIARGADGLLFFRWRTCRFGAEEYWCGILDHDDQPRRRFAEFRQMGAEMAAVGPAVLGTSVRVDVAIAWGDYDAISAGATYASGLPGDAAAMKVIHREFNRRGYAVGLVHPADDLIGIKAYLLPHWELIQPNWVPRLTTWVEAGGVLVVGARCGTRTIDNHIVAETRPGCLRDLAGVTVEEYGRINHPQTRTLALRRGEDEVPVTAWYELLSVDPGTTVAATWVGQHLEGLPAITVRPVGQGHVIYVGAWIGEDLLRILLPLITSLTDLRPLPGAMEGLQVVCRQGADRTLWFLFNTSLGPITANTPAAGIDLLTGTRLGTTLTLERFGCALILADGKEAA